MLFFIATIEFPIFLGDEKNRIYFVTTPRFQAGVPATLGKVTNEKNGTNQLIAPYPDWNWHQNPTQCFRDRLISVFRIQVSWFSNWRYNELIKFIHFHRSTLVEGYGCLTMETIRINLFVLLKYWLSIWKR